MRVIGELEAEMMEAASALEYERAALIRDQIAELRRRLSGEQRGGENLPPRQAGVKYGGKGRNSGNKRGR